MKAVAAVFAAIAFASVAARGQGQFLFDTHDPTAGNDVRLFYPDCQPASGPDLFVEVLAGPDAATLMPLTPLLSFNRTGADAGYPSPFAQIYTVPGMAGGMSALVGYRFFQGTSWNSAVAKSSLALAPTPVALSEPPTPPNEVALGMQIFGCPEPPTWVLALLGLGPVTFCFRRERCRVHVHAKLSPISVETRR